MVMVDGKPGIYTAAGYSSYLYAREVKGWRDTEIFKFDDANATQVTIENKNGELSFTKGDKLGGHARRASPSPTSTPEKVKDAVRAFKALNAEDFGDGKSPADTGLDTPEATVTINLKDDAGKYVLKVGKTSSGTSRYAQKEGDATVFVIPQFTADWALAEPSKFQKPKDAGADAGKGGAALADGHAPGHADAAGDADAPRHARPARSLSDLRELVSCDPHDLIAISSCACRARLRSMRSSTG